MKLEVVVYSKARRRIPVRYVKNILQQSASCLKTLPQGTVSVVFVGDKKMRELNRLYRGRDKTTNVLSFSVMDGEDLGDIFICYPEAVREAKQYGLILREELKRLLIHGFLHLLGHDHEVKKDAKKMEKMEAFLGKQC